MKIISRGVPPSEAIHRATCTTCKTEVEFERKEGKMVYDQRDGDSVTVTCPVCGATIWAAVTYRSLR